MPFSFYPVLICRLPDSIAPGGIFLASARFQNLHQPGIFGDLGAQRPGNAYVIENIIMFIPWGMLLPLLIAPMQKRGWLCVLTAFLASVSLETVQYLTQRGHCQLDDVIMNTLGAFAGWLVIRVMLGVISHLEYHTSRR